MTAARHPREIIRKAITERLAGWRIPPEIAPDGTHATAGEHYTMACERVFDSRVRALDERTDLPAILVYARKERIDLDSYPKSGEDGAQERTIDLAIEAVVRALDDVDDQLDAFALQIETALEWFEVPGLPMARIRLAESDIEVSTDGRTPLGAVRLVYAITYLWPWRTVEPEGETPREVYLGQAPQIGAGHAEDYARVFPR